MCLAVPGRIKNIEEKRALVDFGGVFREVSLDLIDKVKVGDFVLVHAGFAIGKVKEEEAQETLKLIEELREALESSKELKKHER